MEENKKLRNEPLGEISYPVSLVMPASLYTRLEQFCKENDRTVSSVVREAVKLYFEFKEEVAIADALEKATASGK